MLPLISANLRVVVALAIMVGLGSCQNKSKNTDCNPGDTDCVNSDSTISHGGGNLDDNNTTPTQDNNNPEEPDPTSPILEQVSPVIYAAGYTLNPLVFQNSGTPIIHCEIVPPLPDGMALTVDNGTCQINGTPTQTADTEDYLLTAKDTDGNEVTLPITITVRIPVPPVASAPPPASIVSTLTLEGIVVTNTGDAAVSCAIDPPLPNGLTINVDNDTCVISGAATESRVATDYTITLTALDGSTDTTILNLEVVAASPPVLSNAGTKTYVTTVSIPSLEFTNSGNAAVSCSGAPSLPDGLSLNVANDSCRISGTPTTAQGSTVYTVTAKAADNTTSSATVIITINAASPPNIANAPTPLELDVGVAMEEAFRFTNSGAEVVDCSISPDLPSGLSLNVADHSCEISGEPSLASGSTPYTVTAMAADGSQDTATITIVVSGGSMAMGHKRVSVNNGAGGGWPADAFCVINPTGNLYCWGRNSSGQLGYGNTDAKLFGHTDGFVNLGGIPVLSVAAGDNHTCVILEDQALKCWGSNGSGQLGKGTTGGVETAPGSSINLGVGRTATAVTAAGDYTCALLDNGEVKCWGYNMYGQLGNGTTTTSNTPGAAIDLGVGRYAISISASSAHTCAVLDNGALKCWGDNTYGQLGNGTSNNTSTTPGDAINLGAGHTALAVAPGRDHTCALLDTYEIKCWGFGGGSGSSPLGYGDTIQRNTPPAETVNLGLGRTAKSISSGQFHTCAILDNNDMKCWGDFYYHDSLTSRTSPGPAKDFGGPSAIDISLGCYSTIVLLDNDEVEFWPGTCSS